MIDDAMNRLKVKRGSQLPQSKLSEADVVEIFAIVDRRDHLKRRLSGMTNAAIAQQYGVHVRTVDKVVQGNGWTHVESGRDVA